MVSVPSIVVVIYACSLEHSTKMSRKAILIMRINTCVVLFGIITSNISLVWCEQSKLYLIVIITICFYDIIHLLRYALQVLAQTCILQYVMYV